MKLDCKRLGRYMILVNILVSALLVYVASEFLPSQAAPKADARLFAPIEPLEKDEPERKGIFGDYSAITPDRFLPRPEGEPGESELPVPVPGPTSALDRLLKLRGTAVSSDKARSFAIVDLLQEKESRTVRVGDEIVGARVLQISENSILLLMEEEEITLPLNATEEYGTAAKKAEKKKPDTPQKGDKPWRERFGKPGRNGIPPEVEEYVKTLPPEIQKMWNQATPEQKKRYIQKFMERQKKGKKNNKRPKRPSTDPLRDQ